MATQLALTFPASATYAAEDFVVTDANRDAHRWLESWPQWPGNALIVSAPAGAGKTHLASLWQARASARPIAADELGSLTSAELLGDARAALLESADHASANAHTAAGLFHLLNHIASGGGTLLLTASTPPESWSAATPDLRSRLLALPHAAMGAPDDALLSTVLAKHFADRQLTVAPEVIAYLVPRMERSFSAAARLSARLDDAALAERRAVTLALARKIIETAL